jgi:beta-lactam-binding protein with PASTA domain
MNESARTRGVAHRSTQLLAALLLVFLASLNGAAQTQSPPPKTESKTTTTTKATTAAKAAAASPAPATQATGAAGAAQGAVLGKAQVKPKPGAATQGSAKQGGTSDGPPAGTTGTTGTGTAGQGSRGGGTSDGPPLASVVVPRVIVPDVRGRTPGAAQEILQGAGLKAGSMQQTTGPGTPGTVSQESPPQGTVVYRGSPVNLGIVAAPQTPKPNHNDGNYSRQVPSVIGRTPEQAQAILKKYGLNLGSQANGPGSGTVGTIYAQNPRAGQWVEIAVRVDVQLVAPQPKPPSPSTNNYPPFGTNNTPSANNNPPPKEPPPKEPPLIIVPNLSGQTIAVAAQILNKSDLRAGTAHTGTAAAPAGTIYGQQPQAGSRVRAGTTVDVLVAAEQPKEQPKPALVPVPDVRGSSAQTAGMILQHSRLNLGNIGQQESASNVGRISTQTPPPGTRVAVGSNVDVVVATEIPTVAVPNVVSSEESRAADTLANDRLKMGRVTQRPSDQPSGTVLAENPPAGTRVRAGSGVDIVVSRQIDRQLTVMVDQPNPEAGSPVRFHAHLEPEDPGFQYQFVFGDGKTEGTGGDSTATHVFENAGAYQVSATATRGAMQVASPAVRVTAKDVEYQVAVTATPPRAKPDTEIALIVKNSRAELHPSYQFEFADGTQSDWSAEPFVRHSYHSGGTYPVKVRARLGNGPVVESAVQSVEVESTLLPVVAGLIAGLAGLGLGGGAYVYHGWKKFGKAVRAVPKMDAGKQELRARHEEARGEAMQLRVVWPRGEQLIHWRGSEPRKAEGHD